MTITTKPKVIAFDIDNTLVVGPEAQVFYREYARALEAAFAKKANISLQDSKTCLDVFRLTNNGRGELAFPAFGFSLDDAYDAICRVSPTQIPRMDLSAMALAELKSHAVLVAITDGPAVQAMRLLNHVGIDITLFSEFVAWERGGTMPKCGKSDVFVDLVTRYRLDPEEILMVGDSLETDIIPAREVGLQTLRIGNEPGSLPNIDSLRTLYV